MNEIDSGILAYSNLAGSIEYIGGYIQKKTAQLNFEDQAELTRKLNLTYRAKLNKHGSTKIGSTFPNCVAIKDKTTSVFLVSWAFYGSLPWFKDSSAVVWC